MNTVISRDWQPPLPSKGIFRVLVCRPNHRLGNTVLLTPLIAELERQFKGAEIDVICEGTLARDVFASYISIKNIYCLPARGFKHPLAFLRLIKRVLRTRYDLVIDPTLGSGFARALTRICHGNYKLGFGDQTDRSGLTLTVPPHVATRHMAKRPIDLLRWALGLPALVADGYPSLDIRLTKAEIAQGHSAIASLLQIATPTVQSPVIGVFANATGAKRYPMDWWREFIDTFKTLCPAANIIELIPMSGGSMLGAEWPGYYSSDIRRMAAVMSGLDLMITGDCGVMHLAAASRVPTTGLFKVTDPEVYEPYGPGNHALHTEGLSAREVACRVVAAHLDRLGSPASGLRAAANLQAVDLGASSEAPLDAAPISSTAWQLRTTP